MPPESLNLNSNGSVFHNFGATTGKARSEYVFKRAVGVAKSGCDDDLKYVLLDGLVRSIVPWL